MRDMKATPIARMRCPRCGGDTVYWLETMPTTREVLGIIEGEIILADSHDDWEGERPVDQPLSCSQCDYQWAWHGSVNYDPDAFNDDAELFEFEDHEDGTIFELPEGMEESP